MREYARPRLVVSQCLEFDACRYNGDMIHNAVVKRLMDFVDFVPVCPEVEIGLGTPRETIRIVGRDGVHKLLQPATGNDVTEAMSQFSDRYLNGVSATDGFILKSRSPSCGLKEVRVYAGVEKGPAIGHASGLFGGKVMERFGVYAVEEEGRLNNFTIRDRFYTKIFTLASFRALKEGGGGIDELHEFHERNLYLFMAYSNPTLKVLDRILKSSGEREEVEVMALYEKALLKLFNRAARYDSNLNVAQAIATQFDGKVSDGEMAFFHELADKYSDKKEPFSSIVTLLKSWAVRFEDDRMLRQTFFAPYPEKLLEITDSGKGRDY
ncbi:YbgA family protein [Fictibacillus iocasae]|uniref:YbgA family protein n=1 Tax=Fictibacillus iocasae TaxID=2715437 RepID=A0ABW2NR69_9BACL